MSDDKQLDQNQGEQSTEHAGDRMSLRTNARLREKYYVDQKDVFSSIHAPAHKSQSKFSRIITNPKLNTSTKPIMIRCNRKPLVGEIQVDVIREGPSVSGIRINCPCGRHTELNFEYKTET